MNDRPLPLHVRMIEDELKKRQAKNPRYSLRAFAKVLEIHPSALSRILNGKQDLSTQACAVLIKKLAFSGDDLRLFIASVADDKRNRASATMVGAIDPSLFSGMNIDPRFETIVSFTDQTPLRLMDILALNEDLVSVIDLKGRFLFVNEAGSRMLGSIPCDLIGETWTSSVLDHEASHLLTQQQNQSIAAGKEKVFEFDLRLTGVIKTLVRTITPILGSDGSLSAFVSTIKDVTMERFTENVAFALHSTLDLSQILNEVVSATVPLLSRASFLTIRFKADDRTEHARSHHESQTRTNEFTEQVSRSSMSSLVEAGRTEVYQTELSTALSTELDFGDLSLKYALIAPFQIGALRPGNLIFLSDREFPEANNRIANQISKNFAQAAHNAIECA